MHLSFQQRVRALKNASQAAGDQGSALVIAIASVVLTGLLMAVVFSSVMFTIGHTSASRAEAESRSAAEGGAQQLARHLMDKTVLDSFTCATDWNSVSVDATANDPSGAYVDYQVVDVAYKPPGGLSGNWVTCRGGESIPALADGLRIRSIGYTKSKGVSGHARGDESAVEITYLRPKTVSFDKAIFSNGVANLNSDSFIRESGEGRPSDVVTNGEWICSTTNVIEGSVYALGGASARTKCHVEGDLYVNGNFTVSVEVIVGGDLIVNGNLTASSSGLKVAGKTLIHGNFNMGGLGINEFNSDTYITGSLSGWESRAAEAFKANLYIGGTAFSGLWDRANFVNILGGENIYGGSTTPGARLFTSWNTTGEQWELPTIMTDPTEPDRVFPALTPAHDAWTGMTVANWDSITAGIGMGSNSCQYYNYSEPIVINEPTQIDMTNCSFVQFQNINFVLNDDLVLFVNALDVTGPMTVKTNGSPNIPNPTLFLVSPSPSATDAPTCTNSSAKRVKFSVPQWSQEDADGVIRTKVFMYSTGETYIASRLTGIFHGQLYGCDVHIQSGVDMRFGKAGNSDQTDTLFDLRLTSVRELTDLVAP